jgi:putative sterol carrier protein
VLAQRLRELERAGVVRRRKLPPPTSARVYELTEWGQELEPVLRQLGRWGSRSPHRLTDAGMSVDSHLLAMRAIFSPEAAGDFEGRFAIELGEHHYALRIAGGEFEVARGDVADPDAALATDPDTLISLVFGGADLGDAVTSGRLRLRGDEPAARRLLELFPLREPAPLPAA